MKFLVLLALIALALADPEPLWGRGRYRSRGYNRGRIGAYRRWRREAESDSESNPDSDPALLLPYTYGGLRTLAYPSTYVNPYYTTAYANAYNPYVAGVRVFGKREAEADAEAAWPYYSSYRYSGVYSPRYNLYNRGYLRPYNRYLGW